MYNVEPYSNREHNILIEILLNLFSNLPIHIHIHISHPHTQINIRAFLGHIFLILCPISSFAIQYDNK